MHFVLIDGDYLKSSELVSRNETLIASDLPYSLHRHCLMKVNDSFIVLTGGRAHDSNLEK